MARSPAHRFGQIIGDVLEAALKPLLADFAEDLDLFLDTRGARATRTGRKLVWTDRYGNSHELDYVLERGGTADEVGTPAAFIESAYRRYTKHSRNKAQEIQAAIMPLLETYGTDAPFAGVVLGGVFTSGSLQQLESRGFKILYFPYEQIIDAFALGGIDARFDEDTAVDELQMKVDAWEGLGSVSRRRIADGLIEGNEAAVKDFMEALSAAVTRRPTAITLLPLHGDAVQAESIERAIEFVLSYSTPSAMPEFRRFEAIVRFNNGDRIEGAFRDRVEVIRFLELFR